MASPRFMLRLTRFMRVKPICNLVFRLRYLYYVRIRRNVRSYDDPQGADDKGLKHNLAAILHGKPSDRILKLIMPLSVIDRMTTESKVLAIGCRYETDLLYLAAYGFHPKNIRGLDLLSYSPWVDLGNMHAMPYADSSWDAAVMGWVLTYSTEPTRAAKEVVRVVKRGGLVAIGITVVSENQLDELKHENRLIASTAQILNVDDVLALFGEYVENIYFRHDRTDLTRQGHCLVIFSIKK